jgi:hypothetical protein
MGERVIIINYIQTQLKISFYYIVESEKLKNTQWDIFHIFTSEDIDHVTIWQFAFEREISQFFAWDYIINIKLHAGLKIWLLSSRVKNNILFSHCARS